MAEIQQQDSGGKGKHGGKPKAKKQSTHVDMTPMVDLAFLLLTFFMLATTFAKPQTMEINMPVKTNDKKAMQKVKESQTITIILSEKNKIFWFMGIADNKPPVQQTDFSDKGIRKLILEKNRIIYNQVEVLRAKLANNLMKKEDFKKQVGEIKSDKNGLIVLIKTDDKAKYKNVVDILDEMEICNVGRYALVDITPVELDLIKPFKTK